MHGRATNAFFAFVTSPYNPAAPPGKARVRFPLVRFANWTGGPILRIADFVGVCLATLRSRALRGCEIFL